ncbi:MAG: ATP-binding protein [Bacteroidales bacterium]|nr:ATP-binding protein [Bacteroidales bacterium]
MLQNTFLNKWMSETAGNNHPMHGELILYTIDITTREWKARGDIKQLTGYEAGDFIGCTIEKFAQYIHPDDRDAFFEIHRISDTKSGNYSIQYRFLRKDGNYSYFLDKGSYEENNSGAKTALGAILDVSRIILTEKRLDTKLRLEKLFNQVVDIAHQVDSAEELIVHTLKHICEVTQWPLAHATVFYQLNHNLRISPTIVYSKTPEKYLQIIENFHHLSSSQITEFHEEIFETKSARWIKNIHQHEGYLYRHLLQQYGLKHLILFPLTFANEVVGIIEFYADNIESDNEWMPELINQIGYQLGLIIELKSSIEQLRKLSMAIEQNYTSIEITDANGVIEYVNPIFLQITGYNLEEIIGKKPSILKSGIHPAAFYEQMWQTISSGKRWQGEICNRKKDGSLFWEQVTISPVKNNRQEIINYVAVKIDITAKRQYEEQLKKAKEEAETANKAKSEFLANMSHEIRTPMNAILGFAEVLSQKITDEQLKSYLDSIKSSGRNLLTLINDVLDLSKIEAGKMKLSREFIDPFLVFKDIEYLFSLRAQEKGLEFKVITDLNLPMGIEIDEVRLRQILINLIGNAIKFTDKGSVIVHVSTVPSATERIDLKIEVKDTGIGIEPAHLQKIFEPFTQLENASTKKYAGTGLGLAITKRLVDLLGGEISVESEPGKGTNFTVTFKQLPSTAIRQQNLEMISIDPKKIMFKSATVIIADDVDNNRKYLKTVIQDTNLEVLESTNGIETYELAKIRRPQLIITDLKMPGMNGFELLSKLRNDPITRQIPVIATTATASIEEQDKLKVHRFDGILIKPIQVNDVYIELMRFLPHEINDEEINEEEMQDVAIVAKADAEIRVVRAILENELTSMWKTFEEQQPLNEVENFAFQIKELGKKYDLEILVSYGNRLLMAVNSFDIDQMLKILSDYPKLLNTFKVVTEEE